MISHELALMMLKYLRKIIKYHNAKSFEAYSEIGTCRNIENHFLFKTVFLMFNNYRLMKLFIPIILYLNKEKYELYRNTAKILQRDSVPSNTQVSVG